jgi:hypothetical protein
MTDLPLQLYIKMPMVCHGESHVTSMMLVLVTWTELFPCLLPCYVSSRYKQVLFYIRVIFPKDVAKIKLHKSNTKF